MNTPPPTLWMRVVQWLRSHPRAIAGVVCILFLVALFRLTALQEWFQLDHLRILLRDHQFEGIAVFVALFVLGNLLHIPGWIFVAAAVLVLGRLTGGLATYLAASLACAITFVLVRWFGGNAIQKLPYPFAQKLLTRLHRHPLRNTVMLRTAFQTLPTLNYALALSGMRFRSYIAGTLLGLPLPIAAYCIFFDAIAHLMHLAA
jgi:uncharacterized membrane protein YdjX (TVP38/TMEM64 family)